MSERTSTQAAESALQLARDFIHFVETKDLPAVAATLAPGAQQLFMHTKSTKTPAGVAGILSGTHRKAICVAALEGRAEVLAYTEGLMGKFSPLVWREASWAVSPAGDQVFFSGKGDMVVARSGRPYRNSYATIFEFEDRRIHRMFEYADAFMYAGLRVAPNGAELKSFLHALKYLLPFGPAAKPGTTALALSGS
jgi:ketosteroid isomerase-like protein